LKSGADQVVAGLCEVRIIPRIRPDAAPLPKA
jgi:hypothetical protein